MAHNTTETDAYSANVVVPDEADNATALSVETAVQYLANRTKFLLAHLTSLSNFDNTTGSRVAAKGIKKARRFTNVAAVQAVVGAAGIDGEFGWVDSTEGWYRFNNGSSTAADQFWVIAPTSGTGRWFRQDYLITDIAHGLPRLDASVKLPVAQLTNRLVSVSVNEQGLAASIGAAFDTETSASFQALGSGTHQLAVTTVVGDILVIDAFLNAKHPTGTGEVALFIEGVEYCRLPVYGANPLPIHFHAKFVATDASTLIEFRGRSVGAADTLSVYTPLLQRAQVFRP